MSQAFIGATYIQNIVVGEVSGFVLRRSADGAAPVPLVVRIKFNPNLNGMWFGGMMKIISNITLLSVVLAGAALIREREHGTIEHLLVMPLAPMESWPPRSGPTVWSCLVTAGLSLWLVVKGVLGVPIAGSLTLFLFGAACTSSRPPPSGSSWPPSPGPCPVRPADDPGHCPAGHALRALTPRESMPAAIQTLMLAAPTTHFVKFAQAILYRGAGFEVVWRDFLAIIAIGAVFFLGRACALPQIGGLDPGLSRRPGPCQELDRPAR
jgi:ABC-2 type transport system permease protein